MGIHAFVFFFFFNLGHGQVQDVVRADRAKRAVRRTKAGEFPSARV